jgi:hypothetical protein
VSLSLQQLSSDFFLSLPCACRQQDAVLPSVAGASIELLDAWWSGHREEVTHALNGFALEVVTPGAIVVSVTCTRAAVLHFDSPSLPASCVYTHKICTPFGQGSVQTTSIRPPPKCTYRHARARNKTEGLTLAQCTGHLTYSPPPAGWLWW